MVSVPISVPMAPRMLTVPTELMVTLDLPNNAPVVPPVVPEIDLTEIKPGPPLPSVRVTLSANVIAPNTTLTFGLLYVVSALSVNPRSAPKSYPLVASTVPTSVLPVPVNTSDLILTMVPMLPAVIEPEPLLILNINAPSVVPPLTVPAVTFESVVLMVTSENN